MKPGRWIIQSVCMMSLLASSQAFAADKGVLQNFEKDNGTSGNPYSEIWHATATVDSERVHDGKHSLKIETVENGGTVGIGLIGEKGYVDLSNAKKITLWVYDTQGENSVELRLKDVNGNGGSGPDGLALWSPIKAKQNSWTKLEWNLKDYPESPNLDKTKISSIELYEFNPGTYYFDELKVE